MITSSKTDLHRKEIMVMEQKTVINFALLGRDIIQRQRFTYHIDPATGNFIYHDSYMETGDSKRSAECYVENNKIRIETPDGTEDMVTALPEDVILPNMQFYPYLQHDFADAGLERKTYKVYNLRTGKVQDLTYIRKGYKQLELAGKEYRALVLQELDPVTKSQSEIWIDAVTGLRLELMLPNNVRMYLTDASVEERIGKFNWDDILFVKTNKFIKNIHGINYMKADAELETVPKADVKDLTLPGQKFSGVVKDGLITGVFEIEYKKYNGNNAPPFPAISVTDSKLKKHLDPSPLIESDDSVLKKKAEEITTGSEDSWAAVCSLCNWVGENISGIGGGSAKNTYDSGKGLCGEQARLLTAFCRAIEIPARAVWGCLYVPEYNGSFGHHAWIEVYMGKANWIPIDPTIAEFDYINSGHIRIGELVTPQTRIDFKKIDILDYQLEQ